MWKYVTHRRITIGCKITTYHVKQFFSNVWNKLNYKLTGRCTEEQQWYVCIVHLDRLCISSPINSFTFNKLSLGRITASLFTNTLHRNLYFCIIVYYEHCRESRNFPNCVDWHVFYFMWLRCGYEFYAYTQI